MHAVRKFVLRHTLAFLLLLASEDAKSGPSTQENHTRGPRGAGPASPLQHPNIPPGPTTG
eukprot:1154090-Pelagomonas_calceolata.AAC.1